ncbi:MAG: AAA family ATPase [Lachnospiraceae bacterium]|nr:AAA family ATPase [Lachnospiraceae bacterium]
MKESILPRMQTETQDTVLGGIIKHLKDKKMVIVLGEPGEGKTITILDFCVQNTCPSFYFRCSPNTTMKGILIFIAKAIGVRVTSDNDQMQELIQKKLKENPDFCFAFDEVEYLANGNCKKLDTIRQIFDETDASFIICGTYELKDMISGEKKASRYKTHNRSQLFRRLRKAEFEMIDEKEIYDYLELLEREYAVTFDPEVKSALVSQCRDRENGGLGNFIEIIELLFSFVRPEWESISYQLIRKSGRVLHTHTEYVQSFTGIKPDPSDPVEAAENPASSASGQATINGNPGGFDESKTADGKDNSDAGNTIDISSLKRVRIDMGIYNDSLRHKMIK